MTASQVDRYRKLNDRVSIVEAIGGTTFVGFMLASSSPTASSQPLQVNSVVGQFILISCLLVIILSPYLSIYANNRLDGMPRLRSANVFANLFKPKECRAIEAPYALMHGWVRASLMMLYVMTVLTLTKHISQIQVTFAPVIATGVFAGINQWIGIIHRVNIEASTIASEERQQ